MSGGQDGPGRVLAGRYRLESVLGQGGMGTVWRAEDAMLGRPVAVKELRFTDDVDEDERRRLVIRTLTEAKAIAQIRHVAAVTVFDVVEEDNRPWIVMELVESRSLSEVIRTDGVLPPDRAAEVALDLLGVLADAHRAGVLHRDVKPSNVLIGHDGRVVLTDFGIARVEGDPSVTSTGMLVGAPSYISPERARGQVAGAPSDLWSLGATLYAMCEGRPPYDKGSALSTLTAVMTEELAPPVRSELLAPVITGLLRKDPAERLDAATAHAMLQGVLGEYARRARVGGGGGGLRPGLPEPRGGAAKGVGAGASAGGAGGGGAAVAGGAEPRTQRTLTMPAVRATSEDRAEQRPSRKPVIGLALVVLLVLAAVAGYAVWHHQHHADDGGHKHKRAAAVSTAGLSRPHPAPHPGLATRADGRSSGRAVRP